MHFVDAFSMCEGGALKDGTFTMSGLQQDLYSSRLLISSRTPSNSIAPFIHDAHAYTLMSVLILADYISLQLQ